MTKGATQVEIVSDSELLVKQMLGIYRVKHPNLVPMYQKAKILVRHFGRFSIRHTLRAGNKDADRLANLAVDRAEGRVAGEKTCRGLMRSAPALAAVESRIVAAAARVQAARAAR